MSRLWEKGLPLDERVLRYTAGEDHVLDARLVPYDVRGSIAHAEMLAAQELISKEDCHAICDGLRALQKSFEAGEWQITLEDEDVHTALESRLTQHIGEAGGRLHLGRSRNDQVLTALRLYLRDAALDLAGRVEHLRASLAHLADRQGEVELPGYTHMQHAMPSSVELWCGGFNEGLGDAVAGLRTVDRVGDWLTQDEINLILGGTAAKLYKLPVPHSRMFPEGRPDIFGDKAAESIPIIPREQIQFPDPEGLKMSTKPCKGGIH
jgi:argininosuccinate lyase